MYLSYLLRELHASQGMFRVPLHICNLQERSMVSPYVIPLVLWTFKDLLKLLCFLSCLLFWSFPTEKLMNCHSYYWHAFEKVFLWWIGFLQFNWKQFSDNWCWRLCFQLKGLVERFFLKVCLWERCGDIVATFQEVCKYLAVNISEKWNWCSALQGIAH